MKETPKELSVVLDFFKDSIIGKNTKGIVHNLNSPIQVLSMNIELLIMDLRAAQAYVDDISPVELNNQISQALDRVKQIDEIVSNITGLIRLMGTRMMPGEGETEESPIILSQILTEATELWKADLFFKHQVELDMKLTDTSPVIIAKEKAIRDLLDGIFFSSIELLKNQDSPYLKIEMSSDDTNKCKLFFKLNNPVYPVEQIKEIIEKEINSYSLLGKGMVVLGLMLSIESAKEIPAVLDLKKDCITILFNS